MREINRIRGHMLKVLRGLKMQIHLGSQDGKLIGRT